jgi:heme o synthase
VTIAGMAYLAASVNLDAALWATLTMALYVFVYTPLKRVTTLNTLVGAVPGAIPPLIGWTAAQGSLDARAWSLFAIIFVWQLPHFLAIAWMYREDYQRAGLLMLPTVDDGGHSTGRQVVLHSLSLIPVTLIPVFLKMAGGMYFVSALVLGVLFLAAGVNFASKRTDAAARVLFLASVAYLPLLLALLIVDKI